LPVDPARLSLLIESAKLPPWLAELHPMQKQVALSKARWRAITCARRAGKTVLDTALAADSLHASGHDETTLYLARNRSVAKELFWPKIRGLVKRHNLPWALNEAELRVTTPAGGVLLVKGAEGGDPEEEREKLRGLKMRRVICDEPATYSATLGKLLKDVIEPGLGDLRGDCIVNGTPGIVCSGTWHEISTGVLPVGDKRPKISLEKWARWHWDIRRNPFFKDSEQYLQEVLAENGWTEENPTFQREYLGMWVVDESAQVYRYVDTRNAVTSVPGYNRESDDWAHTIGADFGVNDACAWTVLASHRHSKEVYVVESVHHRGKLPEEAAGITRELVERYHPHRLVGDAGGLGKPYVEEFNRRFPAGIRMVAAEKTEKRANIELINGDLGSGRLKLLMPACTDLAEQMKTLPWANDEREYEHQGYSNDLCDSCLYGWRAHRAYLNEAPAPPKPRLTPDSDEWIRREEERFMARQRAQEDWWDDG
jgi:hypothetical protein